MRAYPWFTICLIVLAGAAVVSVLQVPASALDSVALETRSVGGATVSLITADLNDATVKVDIGLPERGISHAESFGRLVNRRSPLAAVTGTYFDIATSIPTGSIVIDGKLVHESHIGTAVCFTRDNKVRFVDAKKGEPCDLSCAECAVRTGPRLLANGEYALNPRREGFREPGLYGARTRMVLGVTVHNKLLLAYVRTPVTFAKAASIMRALGAVDAVCLDGGTSSAMYYRGQVVRHPGRMLTNVIEVRRRTMPALAPQLIASTAACALQQPILPSYVVGALTAGAGAAVPSADLGGEEHAAVLENPVKLRPTKGLHTLFPVNRAKLTGLKGFDHS